MAKERLSKELSAQMEQEKAEAEFAQKKEKLIASVVKSGQISREEIESSEELKGYVDTLDKKSLMSIVGERLTASMNEKPEKEIETSETKEVRIDEFKAQLLAEIEAEKENKPNDETVNDSETNTDDEEDKSFKDVIEETKEKIKESKPLQIVTATLSVALAGLLAYAIYLLTRKVIRWAKN